MIFKEEALPPFIVTPLDEKFDVLNWPKFAPAVEVTLILYGPSLLLIFQSVGLKTLDLSPLPDIAFETGEPTTWFAAFLNSTVKLPL